MGRPTFKGIAQWKPTGFRNNLKKKNGFTNLLEHLYGFISGFSFSFSSQFFLFVSVFLLKFTFFLNVHVFKSCCKFQKCLHFLKKFENSQKNVCVFQNLFRILKTNFPHFFSQIQKCLQFLENVREFKKLFVFFLNTISNKMFPFFSHIQQIFAFLKIVWEF